MLVCPLECTFWLMGGDPAIEVLSECEVSLRGSEAQGQAPEGGFRHHNGEVGVQQREGRADLRGRDEGVYPGCSR